MSRLGDAHDMLHELRALLQIFHYSTAGASLTKEHENAFGHLSNDLTYKCDKAIEYLDEHMAATGWNRSAGSSK